MTRHSGQCGHCGTPVPPQFTTCPGCGAVWRQGITPFGQFLGFLLAIPTLIAVILLFAGVKQGNGEGLLMAGGADLYLIVLVKVIVPACAVWGWWRRPCWRHAQRDTAGAD